MSASSQQPPATTPRSQHKELCYEGNYGSGSMSPYKYHKKDNNAGMRSSIEMQTAYIKKKYQELGACQRKQTLQKHIFRFSHEHFIHPWNIISSNFFHFLTCHNLHLIRWNSTLLQNYIWINYKQHNVMFQFLPISHIILFLFLHLFYNII